MYWMNNEMIKMKIFWAFNFIVTNNINLNYF